MHLNIKTVLKFLEKGVMGQLSTLRSFMLDSNWKSWQAASMSVENNVVAS
jgi:fluoride ion exporter CrcB/FEX